MAKRLVAANPFVWGESYSKAATCVGRGHGMAGRFSAFRCNLEFGNVNTTYQAPVRTRVLPFGSGKLCVVATPDGKAVPYTPGTGGITVAPGRAVPEVRTQVRTARSSPASSSQMTRSVEPKPLNLVTLEGAYGIRTRAAAVRGRCPRPLDECARPTAQCSQWASRGPRAYTLSFSGRTACLQRTVRNMIAIARNPRATFTTVTVMYMPTLKLSSDVSGMCVLRKT
jgi:hypothetical protein